MRNLITIDTQIEKAKSELAKMYEEKGVTDFEVLKLGEKIDRLINKRSRIMKK
jgi:hypothetical protein